MYRNRDENFYRKSEGFMLCTKTKGNYSKMQNRNFGQLISLLIGKYNDDEIPVTVVWDD